MQPSHLVNGEYSTPEALKKNDIQSARELVKRSLDAADQAEVSRQALIREGRPLIPALEMLKQGEVQERLCESINIQG